MWTSLLLPHAQKGRCLGLGEIEALGEAVLGRQNWLRVRAWVLFAVGNSEWGERGRVSGR